MPETTTAPPQLSDWQIAEHRVWVGQGRSAMYDAIADDDPAFDQVRQITVWRLYRDGAVIVNVEVANAAASFERKLRGWPSSLLD